MTPIWCGIPVFNNAGTIVEIVRRCREQIADVVVVDDGSTDADLRESLAPLGVTVIRHPVNRGKGAALLTAFDFARQHGAEYLISLDGDGQHFPEDIPKFLAQLNPETILIGVREQIVGEMPGSSRFGREFSDFWICVESGGQASDTQSGFRAYPLRQIAALNLASRHYNMEVEVVTRAIWAGLKIQSVPIRVQYLPKEKQVSSFRPVLDNARISMVHTRLVLRQLLPIPHRRIVASEHRAALSWQSILFENSSALGLAAAAALSFLMGIVLWPWGVIAVAYVAIRLHLNKIVSLIVLALCMPRRLPALCLQIGNALAPGRWAWFVGAHVVAFIVSPMAAIVVYAITRRLQRPKENRA
jgi:glycosyltransferase involved in cell wall biosynthesis